MGVYDTFATLYASGDYPQYSQQMAAVIVTVLQKFNFSPNTILDVACGEGTFAIAMTKQGYTVTGIDQSVEMLELAKKKIVHEQVSLTLHQLDMRSLNFENAFDMVTCWFDSLNYLIDDKALLLTFQGIYRALKKPGLFVFDMNTIYWLVTLAQRYPCTIERETSDIFQVHRHSYDFEQNIATFHITGFVKDNNRWLRRVDETHKERGYSINEIRHSLKLAGFTELACWGNLKEQTPFTPENRRVYFVVKK